MSTITVNWHLVGLVAVFVVAGLALLLGFIAVCLPLFRKPQTASKPTSPTSPATHPVLDELKALLANVGQPGHPLFWRGDSYLSSTPLIPVPGHPGLTALEAEVERSARLLQQLRASINIVSGVANSAGAIPPAGAAAGTTAK